MSALAARPESPMGALGPDVHVPRAGASGKICKQRFEKITHKVVAGEKDMAERVVLPRTLDGQPGMASPETHSVPRAHRLAMKSALDASGAQRRCQSRRKEHP
ncbi:MAG TPA: hypothetical protein VGG33_18130 [Polyangia bacterium]